VTIEDLGSYNGTFVNGARIDESVEVHPGDTVRISTSSLSLLPAADGDDERVARSVGAGDESSLPPGVTLIRPASDLLPSLQATPDPSREPDRLLRFAERLTLLNDVHRALTRTTSLDGLLELILDRLFDHFRPDEAAIFLRRDDESFDRVAVRTAGGRPPEIESGRLELEVGTKGLSLVVLDTREDQRLAGSESLLFSGVRSLLAAPLIDAPLDGGQRPLGMIVLGAGLDTRSFTEGDMELLVSLASAAALRIRNAALTEEAMERRRLEEELTLARSIQVALLTEALPDVAGWELWAGNVPSRRVSGDFYKVVERETANGTELVLLLADVSGKGMAASLLTAALEAMAAGLLDLRDRGGEGSSPATICERLSRLLYRRTPPSKYATGFLGLVEAATGRLRYTSAGHNPVLLVRPEDRAADPVEYLASTGQPLGLLPGARFSVAESTLEPGDLLVLYSDGITEAADPGGEEYGLGRLRRVCVAHREEPLEDLARIIENDLARFADGEPFADDRTLVMVRRSG
jgi:sigma-B regulation protein RsbU (phosphoserine phosphatase)